MKIRIFIIMAIVLLGCNKKTKMSQLPVETVYSTDFSVEKMSLEVYDFNGFEPLLNKNNDTIYVINFWATWCAPCVKELPFFEKLNAEYAGKNVEVILVSLDFPHLYESKLKPFIIEKKLKAKVIALDDVDMNSWIPKVNEAWSGSIPATIIYKNGSRKFFEQSFDYDTLEKEIKQFF